GRRWTLTSPPAGPGTATTSPRSHGSARSPPPEGRSARSPEDQQVPRPAGTTSAAREHRKRLRGTTDTRLDHRTRLAPATKPIITGQASRLTTLQPSYSVDPGLVEVARARFQTSRPADQRKRVAKWR